MVITACANNKKNSLEHMKTEIKYDGIEIEGLADFKLKSYSITNAQTEGEKYSYHI